MYRRAAASYIDENAGVARRGDDSRLEVQLGVSAAGAVLVVGRRARCLRLLRTLRARSLRLLRLLRALRHLHVLRSPRRLVTCEVTD